MKEVQNLKPALVREMCTMLCMNLYNVTRIDLRDKAAKPKNKPKNYADVRAYDGNMYIMLVFSLLHDRLCVYLSSNTAVV